MNDRLESIADDLRQYGLHLPERLRFLAKISRDNHDRAHHREAIVLDDHDWRWLEAVADLFTRRASGQ